MRQYFIYLNFLFVKHSQEHGEQMLEKKQIMPVFIHLRYLFNFFTYENVNYTQLTFLLIISIILIMKYSRIW